jgi:uncharacterized OsmC-like protein
MEATVRFIAGAAFEAESRGHKVLCDQPVDNGGADRAMTPPEYLLVSVGACVGHYALQYLKARNLPTDGLEVRVTAEKAMQPPRLGAFNIEVQSPAASDERTREGLVRASQKCLIHHTLTHPPEIRTTVQTPAEAPLQSL